jgi:hypothetical protein
MPRIPLTESHYSQQSFTNLLSFLFLVLFLFLFTLPPSPSIHVDEQLTSSQQIQGDRSFIVRNLCVVINSVLPAVLCFVLSLPP